MKLGIPFKIDHVEQGIHPEGLDTFHVTGEVSLNGASHLRDYPQENGSYYITDEDPNAPSETTGQNGASPEFLYAPFASVQDRPGRIHLPDDVPWQVIERSMRNETWTITVPDAGSRENAIKLADILNENERIRVNGR